MNSQENGTDGFLGGVEMEVGGTITFQLIPTYGIDMGRVGRMYVSLLVCVPLPTGRKKLPPSLSLLFCALRSPHPPGQIEEECVFWLLVLGGQDSVLPVHVIGPYFQKEAVL